MIRGNKNMSNNNNNNNSDNNNSDNNASLDVNSSNTSSSDDDSEEEINDSSLDELGPLSLELPPMLSSPASGAKQKLARRCLVTGGSGFFGHNLVDTLLENGDEVRVLDITQSFEDDRVDFIIGDLRNIEDCQRACKDIDIVFHVAALTDPWGDYDLFYDVNVRGTDNLINACLQNDVVSLIYTSTGSVVIDGTDIKNGDESLEYPENHLDHYGATKAIAEQHVIAVNGLKNSNEQILSTCSLRPHCMFGPRDNHFIAQLITKAREGDITHMIGDGRNVCDFTYVENVVHAHMLVAEKLNASSCIHGQCYFITNGEPRRFWDFINTILHETGCVGPTKSISFGLAYSFAYTAESMHWILSSLINFRPAITRHMVCAMACHHWFSHDKATRDFGYRPIVSLDEGLEETITYFQQAVQTRSRRNLFE